MNERKSFRVSFGLGRQLVCTCYVSACSKDEAERVAALWMDINHPKWKYDSITATETR